MSDFTDRGRKPMAVPVRQMAAILIANVADMAYRFAFHLVRWVSLVYVGRALKTFPQGVPRVVAAWWQWNSDKFGREIAEVNLDTTKKTRKGSSATNTASLAHDSRVHLRSFISLIGLVAIAAGSWFMWTRMIRPVPFAVGLAAATLVGYVGRDLGQPFTTNPATGSRAPTITAQLLADVLSSIGITALAKALQDPETKKPSGANLFVEEGRTPNNRGVMLRIELPMGITAHMVMAYRDRFVAGLKRFPSQVHLEAGKRQDLLLVTVLDRPANEEPPAVFKPPLPGEVDVFQPMLLGHNPRGGGISATLIYQSLLIGAAPDAGKTSMLRTLGVVAAQDPGVDLAVFELKGTGDLGALAQVAATYRSGSDPNDLAALSSYTRWLRTVEIPRRKRVIKGLSVSDPLRVPDFKITRDLVDDPDVDLNVLIVIVDEFHNASENPEHAEEWNAIMSEVREARAAGVIFVISTQRPDSDAILPRWRDMFTYRLALRNLSGEGNRMILGDGMAKLGFDSTKIGPDQQGTGWLRADDGDPMLVRFGYLDGIAATLALKAAAEQRKRQGTLSGHAAGQVDHAGQGPDTDDRRFIDHVLAVWPAETEWMPTQEIAGRLADGLPRYAGITGGEVTRRLHASHGLTSTDKRLSGSVVKSMRRDHVQAAADSEAVYT